MGTWVPSTYPTTCGSPNFSENPLAASWSSFTVDRSFIYNGPKCSAIALQTILRDEETV